MKDKKQHNKNDLDQVRQLIFDAYQNMNNDPNKCIELSRKALSISQKADYSVGLGMSYMHIGLGYFHQSDYYNALKNYLTAESILLKEKYWYGVRCIYNNIGLIYTHWDDLEKALQYYQKNLDLRSVYNDPKNSSTILNNIGGIYLKLKDYPKALQYYQESLQVCTEINFSHMISVALDNIGRIYRLQNETTKAEQYFLKAIELKESIKDFAGLSNVYQNLAMLKTDAAQNEEALTLLSKALHYSRQVSEWIRIALVYQKFADIYARMGNKEQEKKYLDKCVAVAEPRNYKSILLEVYSNLAAYFENKAQYKKALEYNKKIQQLKDYLSDEKKTRAIEEIKTRMEVERTEKEKEILQQKNSELEKMNKQIIQQKDMLEKADKELKELNQNLEQRVLEETKKRQQQEKIIIQKSKLESLGQLAAGIAHEINQPIGLIKIAIQNLYHKFENNKITDEYLKEKSAFINDNITRITKIIEHIRLFSRDQKESQQKFDFGHTVQDALSLMRTQCRNHNINIIEEFPNETLFALGNKYRLEQVILNLLANSKDALEEKFDEFDDTKKIILRVFSKDNKIICEVEDNGSGLTPEELDRVFEPFFTTKEESTGTGLGLSICYGIIEEMNGKIFLKSDKGKYTIARIELLACGGKLK